MAEDIDRVRRAMLLAAGLAPIAAGAAIPSQGRDGPTLAPTPPMGWNSWNSFATTITEAQAIETARIQRDRLLPAGYSLFTVDHQWYDPHATGYTYNDDIKPVVDPYGRFHPDPVRFPSSAGGQGFTALARQVHALGLRLGIHVMRGIPREAVRRNLPILGTQYHAQDIADTSSTCSWNVDMYGVDMRKPGAQAYYDGAFAQFASWGVDFVKMDDMTRPYDAHAAEIAAASEAIGKCGRPITLSLSPGETPVVRGADVRRHAQMWRISDDFWDEWHMLEAQFVRLENWQPYAGPGSWPDADMLPLGKLALGARDTRFTPAEQRTLMTLWSIARSPLIMGGDLRHLDEATLALLTNAEVIAVNQTSSASRPLFVEDGLRVWTADAPGGDLYLALFNMRDAARPVGIDLRRLGLASAANVRDLWAQADLGGAAGRFTTNLPAHGAGLYRLRG